MPKPDSLQGSLDLLVLKLISRRSRLRGYAVMTALADTSDEGRWARICELKPAMEESRWRVVTVAVGRVLRTA